MATVTIRKTYIVEFSADEIRDLNAALRLVKVGATTFDADTVTRLVDIYNTLPDESEL